MREHDADVSDAKPGADTSTASTTRGGELAPTTQCPTCSHMLSLSPADVSVVVIALPYSRELWWQTMSHLASCARTAAALASIAVSQSATIGRVRTDNDGKQAVKCPHVCKLCGNAYQFEVDLDVCVGRLL
jgi:hypothetical protein